MKGELGVRIKHPKEVAAYVADASEKACALSFVGVCLKLFNEFDLKQ
jgi:hypothetical protein